MIYKKPGSVIHEPWAAQHEEKLKHHTVDYWPPSASEDPDMQPLTPFTQCIRWISSLVSLKQIVK